MKCCRQLFLFAHLFFAGHAEIKAALIDGTMQNEGTLQLKHQHQHQHQHQHGTFFSDPVLPVGEPLRRRRIEKKLAMFESGYRPAHGGLNDADREILGDIYSNSISVMSGASGRALK